MKFVQETVVHEIENQLKFVQRNQVIVVWFGSRITDQIRPSELQKEFRILTGDEITVYAERWVKDNLSL